MHTYTMYVYTQFVYLFNDDFIATQVVLIRRNCVSGSIAQATVHVLSFVTPTLRPLLTVSQHLLLFQCKYACVCVSDIFELFFCMYVSTYT